MASESDKAGEKPSATHVQDTIDANHDHHQHGHHKEFNPVPLSEEAITDAFHIDLSWRSWVCTLGSF